MLFPRPGHYWKFVALCQLADGKWLFRSCTYEFITSQEKANLNADALSRFLVETDLVDTAVPTSCVLLATMQTAQAIAKDGDTPLDVRTTISFTEAPIQAWMNGNMLILS